MVADAVLSACIGPGDDGQAVRLGAVVAMLAERDKEARMVVAERVLLALEESQCELYRPRPGEYAVKHTADGEWFETVSGAPGPKSQPGRRVLSRSILDGGQPCVNAKSLGRGMPGLLAWLKGWCHLMKVGEAGPGWGAWWHVVLRESDARRLWGWGEVAPAEALRVPGVAPAVTITEADVTDWPSLVLYRLESVCLFGEDTQKRPTWSSEHVAILAAQLHQECQAGRGKGALARLAKELGTSRQALIGSQKPGGKAGPLVRFGYSVTTGLKPATPFDGLGTSKNAA